MLSAFLSPSVSGAVLAQSDGALRQTPENTPRFLSVMNVIGKFLISLGLAFSGTALAAESTAPAFLLCAWDNEVRETYKITGDAWKYWDATDGAWKQWRHFPCDVPTSFFKCATTLSVEKGKFGINVSGESDRSAPDLYKFSALISINRKSGKGKYIFTETPSPSKHPGQKTRKMTCRAVSDPSLQARTEQPQADILIDVPMDE